MYLADVSWHTDIHCLEPFGRTDLRSIVVKSTSPHGHQARKSTFHDGEMNKVSYCSVSTVCVSATPIRNVRRGTKVSALHSQSHQLASGSKQCTAGRVRFKYMDDHMAAWSGCETMWLQRRPAVPHAGKHIKN